MKSILHHGFRYVPSHETDLHKTFARIRREQKAAAERDRANVVEAAAKVEPLRRKK